jgi:hypothetical protein
VNNSHGVGISSVVAGDRSTGVSLSQASDVRVSKVLGQDYSLDVEIHLSSNVVLRHLQARGHSVLVYVY